MELERYIRTFDNVVAPDVCKSIIESFSKSESEYVDREQRPSFSHFNISKRYNEQDPLWVKHHDTLMDAFDKHIEEYVRLVDCGPDFPFNSSYEEFRIKKYGNDGHDQFKDHVDVQDYATARRFLVLFLYLNDVAEGGETHFPMLDLKITPVCGRLLIFPPTWMFRHAGLSPVTNEKYIVGSYLHYL